MAGGRQIGPRLFDEIFFGSEAAPVKPRVEFSAKTRDQAFARAGGKCQICGLLFGGKKPEYDHILPAALGGDATLANCAVICGPCHRAKTAKDDVPKIRKADRQRKAHVGAELPKAPIQSRGFPPSGKQPRIEKQSLAPRALYEDVET